MSPKKLPEHEHKVHPTYTHRWQRAHVQSVGDVVKYGAWEEWSTATVWREVVVCCAVDSRLRLRCNAAGRDCLKKRNPVYTELHAAGLAVVIL